MLRLLLGTDWVSIRNEILRRLSADIAAEKSGRILMVPELISHDTERDLCKAAGDTASRFAEVLSFTRLVRRVAESAECAMEECLDNGGRVVAMAAAARQLHSRLKAYAAVETKPEFLTELVDAVDEFKRCCISAEDLNFAAGQTEGSLSQKLEELSLLLSTYDALCSQGKRDPRDQMTWLLSQLEGCNFGEDHVFYIDGFPDYTRQHLAILEHLIGTSEEVTVGLNCDAVHSSALAFEKAGNTAAELIQRAKNAGVEVKVELIPARNIPLKEMCLALFQGKTPENVPGLHAIRAGSLFEEVQLAAETVMQLVQNGCRYRDISIVCTDMGAYQNPVAMEFRRWGIPVYQAGTEDVLQKTAVATVLSAMDAALGGFEQRDVLRYLKSILSPLDPDTCDRVENYAVLWGIQRNRWQTEWTQNPDGLTGEWTEEARIRLRELNEARVIALEPLFRLRQGFQNAKNLAEQTGVLYDFLEEIHLAEGLDALAKELDAAGDKRSAQILNQLWEILLTAIEQMHDVLGSTVWEPETFTRLFTLLLSQYDVGTIPTVLDAVMVGSVSAMRCRQVKHLLVLGAGEGALPGYGGSSGLLTDQERVALRQLGVPLTGGAMEGIQAEFAEIYGVFCGAEETVHVFCPDDQPSFIFRRLAKMAGGEIRGECGVGAAAADPAEAGAFLARWRAEETAADLGLEESYRDIREKIGFEMGSIQPENIRRLYGSRLNLSASQVDCQAECRMSYFLKYGMRAKERKEATVDPAEFGTYVHAVLEQTAAKVMELGGFVEVSLEEILKIAREYSDAYSAERFSQMDSKRIAYLFRRNWRELEMVVEELWKELKESLFSPEYYELAFGGDGAMKSIEISGGGLPASLQGFVDRVDIWKENGQSYFRVVDYKTGKKDFDYCDVFNGVGLQMLIYLFALEQEGESLIGEHGVGCGVQYFPARAPLVTADGRLTDQEAEIARQKEWKRRGLLLRDNEVLEAMEPGENTKRLCFTKKSDGTLTGDLADRDQFKQLRTYVFGVLRKLVDEIASGDVTPNPYTRGNSHNACSFCPYSSVCHKASVSGRRNYKAMTAQRFWEEIEREVDSHG